MDEEVVNINTLRSCNSLSGLRDAVSRTVVSDHWFIRHSQMVFQSAHGRNIGGDCQVLKQKMVQFQTSAHYKMCKNVVLMCEGRFIHVHVNEWKLFKSLIQNRASLYFTD